MYLELEYYGQNDGTTIPDLTLTGDPGVDNAALTAAGYNSGALVSVKAGTTNNANGVVVNPFIGNSTTEVPYGFLLLGAGQFSSSITPSGSGKTPVVRAFPKFKLPSSQVDAAGTAGLGKYIYGSAVTAGKVSFAPGTNNGLTPVGIATHLPTAAEPWLGVASLL